MLFLTYWELNEGMSEQTRTQIVQKLMSTGLYPPKGYKILRFDVTPDAWGIVVAEADSAADVNWPTTCGVWPARGFSNAPRPPPPCRSKKRCRLPNPH